MKRHLPLVLVSIVVVLCLVGAVVAGVAAGSGSGAVAYRVDGTQVSQATIDRELSWFATSPAVAKGVAAQGQTLRRSQGSINSELSASWLTQRIEVDVLRSQAKRSKVKVSDALRARIAKQVAGQVKGAPTSVRDYFVDLNAYVNVLGFASQTDLSTFLGKAFAKSDVTVDPRYGTWHPTRGVCPPSGCPAAASSGG
jgi:hypothetical protein